MNNTTTSYIYRCKNYSEKVKLCSRNYNTNTCPTYVYNLSPKIFSCNEGLIEVDWVTNIAKRYIIMNCYKPL